LLQISTSKHFFSNYKVCGVSGSICPPHFIIEFQVLEEQLKLEQEREAELDLLYREEARRMWEQREDEWKRERLAREKLMQEVQCFSCIMVQCFCVLLLCLL